MSYRAANRTSSNQQTRKRQWFLKRLWHAVMGESVGIGSHARRFGLLESLEERRVLATLYATSDTNDLITFDSATPGTIATSIGITGLDANTVVRGIDFRPATGQLYALGIVNNGPTQTGRLYQLNTANAVATPVGPAFSSSLSDALEWEIDFNPTVDRIRVVNGKGDNLRLNPNDGSLVATDTSLSPTSSQVRGIAYDRNEGASLTTLYAYDFTADKLATIGGIDGIPSPNGGVINTFDNPSGIFALGPTPFDIGSGSSTGFLVTHFNFNVRLFSMNLSTGAATNLGVVGSGATLITGLAVPLQSLTVPGTAGADTLVINATGPNSGSYSLNGGPAVAFSNLTKFSFIGGTGNDTLTINNPAGGLFAPSGGIDYNGGGQAGDTLELLGGGSNAFSQTYFVGTTAPPIGNAAGDNGSGLIRFTGPTPVDIRFTGLAPVIDTSVASSLTITSTDAANAISLTNGSAGSFLKVAVDAFEPIEFTNKGTLNIIAGDGIAGGDAGDTIDIDFSNIPAGLTAININADEGDDIINVQTKAGPTLSVFGNDGTNTLNVGKAGTLDGIVGAQLLFFCNPTVIGDILNLNDAADTSSNTYIFNNNFFVRSGTASVGWTGTIGQTTLNAGTGSDVINASGGFTAAVTNVNAGGGDDLVTVGFNNTLNFVAGPMNIAGQAGTNDRVVIDDSANIATSTINVTSTTVTRVGRGTITYGTIESLTIQSGTLADVINLSGTSASTSVTTGAGDDTIAFGNGVSLNGGTVDGGANTDTIDYSAYSTSVSVNLGSNAPGGGLVGVIDGGQENPGQVTTATGTVTITNYNSITKTFDISANVSNLLPSAVTGFHIHRAPVGVNGPIILDLAAIFGLGSLIADGLGGFNFNATGVSLPAQHEAAFLGGITYFNVHTAAATGGLVRGQILPAAVLVAAPGTATGTAGINNIENATGEPEPTASSVILVPTLCQAVTATTRLLVRLATIL